MPLFSLVAVDKFDTVVMSNGKGALSSLTCLVSLRLVGILNTDALSNEEWPEAH